MHKYRSTLLCRALLLIAAATGSLRAQESFFTTDLKLRGGYSLDAKDHLRPGTLGFGLDFGFSTGIGKIGAELGYFYETGDQHVIPITGDVPSGKQPVDVSASGDERRNQLDGFALRLSLKNAINSNWDWQAGLMLGGTRFKHEYVGDVRSQNWDADHADAWRDTYSGTPSSGGVKVSPYAGVVWKVDKDSSFEFNLLILNYQAVDHVHRFGTAAHGYSATTNGDGDPIGPLSAHNDFPGDSDVKTNRLAPQIEVGYVFHF